MMSYSSKLVKLFGYATICILFIILIMSFHQRIEFRFPDLNTNFKFLNGLQVEEETKHFAVFSCATPSKDSHRGFDYAFYLPLTVLAWQRVGFNSIVVIIGERQYWLDHPTLSFVLESLSGFNETVRVVFIPAKPENQLLLSQTSRLFVANMNLVRKSDYIITSDADLWPLSASHFVPRANKSLILVHSHCCGDFQFNKSSYRMIPMVFCFSILK